MYLPSFADMGKATRDVFNKGFGFGIAKLDVKKNNACGVDFKACGIFNTDTKNLSGGLEAHYKRSEYGLTITKKLNADKTLAAEITIEDQIAKGLNVTINTSLSLNNGTKSGKVTTAYKHKFVNVGWDVDFNIGGPTIHGAAVVGYKGWLAGYQMSIDTAESKLTENNFALGYKTGDLELHTNVRNEADFSSYIYQKVNDKLETAIIVSSIAGSDSTNLCIAAKYQIHKDTSISAKVNNNSHVGIGCTQTLAPGVKITLCGLVDGNNIKAGGHKLGLGLELDV